LFGFDAGAVLGYFGVAAGQEKGRRKRVTLATAVARRQVPANFTSYCEKLSSTGQLQLEVFLAKDGEHVKEKFRKFWR